VQWHTTLTASPADKKLEDSLLLLYPATPYQKKVMCIPACNTQERKQWFRAPI